jgi:pimeloyl-ACP methyl ester carboxylesterase
MLAVDLAFEEFGHSDNAPLIILHGFFASSRNWRQVAEKLALRYHVYVLDMRNHGVSPHHVLMDYPAMSTDLLLFMDVHKLNTVSLLGHSMGGKVAMWFALNYPERLDKLIVVDIAPISYTHCFNNLIQALKELPLHQINNRKEAELWLVEHIPEQSYRQFLLQNLILKEGSYSWRINLDTFYRMAPNIIAFPSVDSIAPYAGSALFLGGENSGYIKLEYINVLFPNALFNIIANAGHWLHVQQPIVFIEEVESYLGSG